VTFLDATAARVLVAAAGTGPASLSVLPPDGGAALRTFELLAASGRLPA